MHKNCEMVFVVQQIQRNSGQVALTARLYKNVHESHLAEKRKHNDSHVVKITACLQLCDSKLLAALLPIFHQLNFLKFFFEALAVFLTFVLCYQVTFHLLAYFSSNGPPVILVSKLQDRNSSRTTVAIFVNVNTIILLIVQELQ